MKNSYTIGVDIGGTHTDAVLIDSEGKVLFTTKSATTEDIVSGFSKVLEQLFSGSAIAVSSIQSIFLGTTHATNAILQKKDLYRVGLLRLAGHNPDSLPPCSDWPEDLKEVLFVGCETVSGGYECHGTPITPLCLVEAKDAIEKLLKMGAESLAVIGVFSPQNGEQELAIKKLVGEYLGESFPLSLSHQVGGVGFIERENSTILNSALKKVMTQGFRELEASCRQLGIDCPLFITQNNGTIIDLTHALEYPVLTISAGPTNSFIGAGRLTGLSDAIIVDIGGTSTDIGLIRKGFPRRSLNTSQVGGVKLNFPMPDVLSIAIGGGSYVNLSNSKPEIGPRSTGKDFRTQSFSFGGNALTLTDVAVKLGKEIPGACKEKVPCTHEEAYGVIREALQRIDHEIALLEGEQCMLPILLVGGGAQLLPRDLLGDRHIIPNYANVANAYGAALAEISGVVDRVVSLQQRETVLQELQEEAKLAARKRGADASTLQIVDLQIIPYHYVPNQMARVVVTAAGKTLRRGI